MIDDDAPAPPIGFSYSRQEARIADKIARTGARWLKVEHLDRMEDLPFDSAESAAAALLVDDARASDASGLQRRDLRPIAVGVHTRPPVGDAEDVCQAKTCSRVYALRRGVFSDRCPPCRGHF